MRKATAPLILAFGLALPFAGCGMPVTTKNATSTAPLATPAAVSTVTVAPEEYTPVPADFKVGISILRKQCFGSAGCNVTYRIAPEYSGPSLTDAQFFTVTYIVQGGEDLILGSFAMHGNMASVHPEDFTSVPRSASKLTVTVTEVLKD